MSTHPHRYPDEATRQAQAERLVLTLLARGPQTRGQLMAYGRLPSQLVNALAVQRILDRLIGRGLVYRTRIESNRIHRLGNYLEPPAEGFALTAQGQEYCP